MDIVGQLQKQYIDFATTLFREGILGSQFVQLKQLEDESNPGFVVELVTLYFEDAQRILNNLASVLQQQVVDFKRVDDHVHQFKGSSANIGLPRVANVCDEPFKSFCKENNLDGCLRCFQQVKNEYCLAKNKLEAMLALERQIVEAGGVVPTIA